MTFDEEELAALSEAQLDVLREIGNVGAGNSATALSRLIKYRIEMNVPHVALVPIEEVPEFVGGPELVSPVFSCAFMERRQVISSFSSRGRVPLHLWIPCTGGNAAQPRNLI